MSRRPASTVLKFILAFGVSFGGILFLRHQIGPHLPKFPLSQWSTTPSAPAPDNIAASANIPAPSKPLIPTPPPESALVDTPAPAAMPGPVVADAPLPEQAARQPAHLRVSVLVGGARHASQDGRIALPGGARFQLEVVSNVQGTLELYEQIPQAGDAALWQEEVAPQSATTSPMLRLDGKQRLETLYLRLRGQNGQTITEQRVEVLHLRG